MPSFKEVTVAIEGIAESVITTFQEVKSKKASIQFGFEVALESRQLMAPLMEGSSTSNLKVTLEYGE